MFNFSAPIAAVSTHPANPNLWGLKNVSKDKWVITTADGVIKDVEPERSVSLTVGTKIQFGKIEGEIRI